LLEEKGRRDACETVVFTVGDVGNDDAVRMQYAGTDTGS
jgi:hypothetical protein